MVRIADHGRPPIVLAPARIAANVLRAMVHRPLDAPDLVLANHPSPTTGLAALALSRLWSCPLVVDFNDLIAQYTADLLRVRSRSVVRALFWVQSWILSHASGAVLVTHHLETYLPRTRPSPPCEVIPNGASVSPGPVVPGPHPAHDPFRLAYAGRFEPWAGSDLMTRLMYELRRRRLRVELRVAGTPRKEAASEGVLLLGTLAAAQVPTFLAESDAVLVPFPPGPTSDAASPLKLFEAWAAGKPVLASDVAGIREVCRDRVDAFLLPPDDANAWADAVQDLIEHPELRNGMGDGARQAAMTATWEVRAQSFARFLQATLRGGRGAARGAASPHWPAPRPASDEVSESESR